ncbi:18605_t:CDS:1, partial [Racocetra persica]
FRVKKRVSSLLWKDLKEKDNSFCQAMQNASTNSNLLKTSKPRFVQYVTKKSCSEPNVYKLIKSHKESNVYKSNKFHKKSNVDHETEHQLIADENRSEQHCYENFYVTDYNHFNNSITPLLWDLFPTVEPISF